MKRYLKSKTLWFNVIVAAATAAEASLDLVQPVLPVNVYAAVAVILAIGNAILRVFTTQALGGKDDVRP